MKSLKLVVMLAVTALILAGCGGDNGGGSGSGGSARLTGQQVVEAFKAAGLEAEDVRPFNVDDTYKAPPATYEGRRFFIPSLGDDAGGRIFDAASDEDRDLIFSYYDSLSKQSNLFFSWVFQHRNVVVQINGDLQEEQARKYEAALVALK